MKKIVVTVAFLASLFLWSCQQVDSEKKNTDKSQRDSISLIDDSPRVTGIGGIFFTSKVPDSTTAWYADNLGITMDNFGAVFESRNSNDPTERNYLRWSISNPNGYFEPSTKGFMINYRVQHIEALVANLRRDGVTVLDSIVEYPYGKFVHILDPENNKIELWEPADRVLTALGGKTNK